MHFARPAALIAAFLAPPASGADILSARYDPGRDEIVARIAYRGTQDGHDYSVRWGECDAGSPPGVVGRLVDAQGDEAAREEFRTTERIPLAGIPCRPAMVTLRLGRVAHASVPVPRRVPLLEGAPARPYQELGRVEARGSPGEQRAYVYAELRRQARELGADAVIRVEERRRIDRQPAPAGVGEAPLLGNALPGPLRKTEPGAFPPAGFDVMVSGPYYEVRGVAVRFAGDAR